MERVRPNRRNKESFAATQVQRRRRKCRRLGHISRLGGNRRNMLGYVEDDRGYLHECGGDVDLRQLRVDSTPQRHVGPDVHCERVFFNIITNYK